MTATVWGQELRPATVSYTHLGQFGKEAVRQGDACLAPPFLLQSWGWQVKILRDGDADLEVEGKHLRVHTVPLSGRSFVPLQEAIDQLGGKGAWQGDVYTITGLAQNLVFEGQHLKLETTLSASATIFRLEKPSRLVMDFKGASLVKGLKFNLPGEFRFGQFQPDTFRIVIEKPGVERLQMPDWKPGRTFDLDLAKLYENITEESAIGDIPLHQDKPLMKDVTAKAIIGPPLISGEKDGNATLTFSVTGNLAGRPSATYVDPTTIDILIPGAAAAPSILPELKSTLVKTVQFTSDSRGSIRAIVSLSAPLAFELSQQVKQIVLRLERPAAGNGQLDGKVIVVDAGHGGADTGARSDDKTVQEKDLTLKIAKLIAKNLTQEGASVILSRSDDTFIPLKERSAIANRSRADIFVSVHINSNKLSNSRSGSITFYHAQQPVSTLLAECIEDELGKVTKLPAIGIWSDTRIYQSGFAVLRNSLMPAVLLELGFINNAKDLKRLQEAEFQSSVALAVVKGLKVFVGDGSKENKK